MLLRSPPVLEKDESVKKYIQSGKLCLIKGDAMSKEDVAAAWDAANTQNGIVDAVIFAVGPTPKFKLFEGLTIDPPNVSTISYLNTLLAIASAGNNTSTSSGRDNVHVPKLVILSAKAVTPGSMASIPAPARLFAGWMFRSLNLDKRGMEALVFHGYGKDYEAGMTPLPSQGILPADWETQLPARGWAKNAVLIRPPSLNDGAEKGKYRVDSKDFLVWRISRRDLVAFIVDRLLASGNEKEWKKYEREVVTIGY